MSERADLRTPCDCNPPKYAGHMSRAKPTAVSNVGWCEGGRTLTPAEVLSVLFPDVDWEALREAVDTDVTVTNHHDADGSPYAVADMLTGVGAWRVVEAARRLLAVYDGKDE